MTSNGPSGQLLSEVGGYSVPKYGSMYRSLRPSAR